MMRLRLTDEQKLAATTGAERVYIEASPGSGKTTVATERFGVTRFGAAGDGGRGVLALSFARSARGELRERVRARWGTNAMRWPHKVWTLDHLHCALVQHLLGTGLITWPGGHKGLEVVDSWRGHAGSWHRDAGAYRRSVFVHDGRVTIGGTAAGPAEYGFTAVGPYRTHLESGLCTHAEIRQVLTSAIAVGSPVQPVITEFLTSTISALIVDEIFDGNLLDLRIVRGAAAGGVPTTLIGDPWQALYAFRGATPELVPQLINGLKFALHPITQSFRFETPDMQSLAAALRSGQPATIPDGDASDCEVVLASHWNDLWGPAHVLPFSFGQVGNRVDAALALLLDHVIGTRFSGLSTFGPDAATILALDPAVLRMEGPACFAQALATLSGGTHHDATNAFAQLKASLIDLGSKPIPNLSGANMTVRYGRLVNLAQRLALDHVVPGLTIHQAKGREWCRVGVALSDAEKARLASGLAQTSETDRAIYVALTRARVATVAV